MRAPRALKFWKPIRLIRILRATVSWVLLACLNEPGSRRLGEPAPAATSCAFRWRDCLDHSCTVTSLKAEATVILPRFPHQRGGDHHDEQPYVLHPCRRSEARADRGATQHRVRR